LQGAPTSLEHARGFYHVTNPGVFFRVVSPATQLFLLVALVCNWKAPGTRWRLAGALVLAILADMITFKFHYPRNAILFLAPLTEPAADLDRVAAEWAAGNYVRIALSFDGFSLGDGICDPNRSRVPSTTRISIGPGNIEKSGTWFLVFDSTDPRVFSGVDRVHIKIRAILSSIISRRSRQGTDVMAMVGVYGEINSRADCHRVLNETLDITQLILAKQPN